jgi:hypothetical protein
MNRLRAFVREPFHLTTALAVGFVLGGFALIGFAWNGAARLTLVALQLPYVVSGGLGGLLLAGTGLALLGVQASRSEGAEQRRELDGVLDVVASVLAQRRGSPGGGAGRVNA